MSLRLFSRLRGNLTAGVAIFMAVSTACVSVVGRTGEPVRKSTTSTRVKSTFIPGNPGVPVGGTPVITMTPEPGRPAPADPFCNPRAGLVLHPDAAAYWSLKAQQLGLVYGHYTDSTVLRRMSAGVGGVMRSTQAVGSGFASSGGSGCNSCGGSPALAAGGGTCAPGNNPIGSPNNNPCDQTNKQFNISIGALDRPQFTHDGTFGPGTFIGEIDSVALKDGTDLLISLTGTDIEVLCSDGNSDGTCDNLTKTLGSVTYTQNTIKVKFLNGGTIDFIPNANDPTGKSFYVGTMTSASGNTITANRDFFGNMTGMSSSIGDSVSITNSGGNNTAVTLTRNGSARTTNLTYDFSGNLTGATQSGQSILTITKNLDLVSNTTKCTYSTINGTSSVGYSNESVISMGNVVQSTVGNFLRLSWNEAGEVTHAYVRNLSNAWDSMMFVGHNQLYRRVMDASSMTITPVSGFTIASGTPATNDWGGITYTLSANSETASGASSIEDVYDLVFTNHTNFQQQSTSAVLNSAGYSTQATTAGATTTITRDAQNRITQTADATGTLMQVAFTADGDYSSITQNGRTFNYSYDANGYFVGVTGPNTNNTIQWASGAITNFLGTAGAPGGTRPEISYTFNLDGTVASETTKKHGTNSTVTYTYDSLGRVTQKTYLDGSTEQIAYDGTTNRILKSKDRVGVVTQYVYSFGRLIEVTVGKILDDDLFTGSHTTVADASKYSITEYSDFEAGTNFAQKVRVNGQLTEYERDHMGRVVKTKRYTSAGKSQTSETIYGSDNRILKEIGFSGCVTWYGRSATTGEVLRTVNEFVPEANLGLTDNASVMALSRSTADDALYAINDSYYDTRNRLYQTIDPMGLVTKHDFNSDNQKIRTTVGYGTSLAIKTETDYDSDGNIQEIRNPRYFDSSDTNGYNKDKTTFTYDDAGRQTSVTRASGTPLASTVSTEYHFDGRAYKSINPLGKVTETLFDSCCDHSVAIKNALGHGSISNSDPVGRVYHTASVSEVSTHTNFLDPVNAKTYSEQTTRYDSLGRTIGQTRWAVPLGQVNHDSVPLAGLDGVSSSDGITSQTLYDSNLADSFGLSSAGGVSVNLPSGGSVTLKLATAIAKLAQAEANGGGGISFDSDAPGSATVIVNHDGSVVSFSISDGAGRNVMSGRLKGANNASPSDLLVWSCVSYDHTALVTGYGTCQETHQIDQDGNVAKVRDDCQDRVKQQLDVLGNSVARTFHKPNNNVVKVTDVFGKFSTTSYDVLGRATSQTDRVGVTNHQTYDDSGMVLTRTDAKGSSSSNEYDTLGRKTKFTDRIGGVTESTFDLASQLVSIEDAEGGVTSYLYSDIGQKTREIHPDHVGGSSVGTAGYGIVEFEYDPIGRMFRKTDQLGDTITFNFNMLSQLTSRDHRLAATSPNGNIADTDSFTFNSLGQLLTAESEGFVNTVSFTYDDFSRQNTESLTIGGNTYTTTVDYDSRSRAYKLTFPDSSTMEKTFTARGQLHLTKYNGTTLDTRSYDNAGRLSSSAYNNGVTNNFSYRDDGLVSSISATHPGGTGASGKVGTYSYTYDANKNKTSESITGIMSSYGFSTPASTGYDAADRLKEWNRTDGNQDQSWNLSFVGDWNSFTEDGVTTTRLHNDAHETTKVGANNLTYDVKGNLTKNTNGHTYTWTQENQLLTANGASYKYDALGRRVSKTVSGSETVFVHHGERVIQDYSAGTLLKTYIHGSYIDEIIAYVQSSDIKHVHRNAQFTTVAITGSTGQVLTRFSASSYGVIKAFSANGTVQALTSVGFDYVYTGRRYDSETGFHYFRARYYDSELGRFIGRDPLSFIDGMSLYARYFGLKNLDPTGLTTTIILQEYAIPTGSAVAAAAAMMSVEAMAALAAARAALLSWAGPIAIAISAAIIARTAYCTVRYRQCVAGAEIEIKKAQCVSRSAFLMNGVCAAQNAKVGVLDNNWKWQNFNCHKLTYQARCKLAFFACMSGLAPFAFPAPCDDTCAKRTQRCKRNGKKCNKRNPFGNGGLPPVPGA